MLFTPYKLNENITLANRLVMAPLTRCFADDDLVPTEAMAQYYAKRAETGLIISEATVLRPDGQGYPNTPGIYSDKQIEGWKKVTFGQGFTFSVQVPHSIALPVTPIHQNQDRAWTPIKQVSKQTPHGNPEYQDWGGRSTEQHQ